MATGRPTSTLSLDGNGHLKDTGRTLSLDGYDQWKTNINKYTQYGWASPVEDQQVHSVWMGMTSVKPTSTLILDRDQGNEPSPEDSQGHSFRTGMT